MRLLDWLTLLFVALKLTDIIDWSWWLVLAPTWVPFGIFVVTFFLVAMYGSKKTRN